MAEDYHKKLKRVRKPRRGFRPLAYGQEDSYTGRDDLPLVMGVMGDFSGNGERPSQSFRDRPFVPIDRDNFNEVMEGFEPTLRITFDACPSDLPKELTLRFRCLDDFHPAAVVKQMPGLQQLVESRQKLAALLEYLPENILLQEALKRVIECAETDTEE